MLWREAACASIGVAVAIDKVSTVMSVFMLSLLFGPFEAAGRLPQLKIKRWAIGTIKLSFRKLNSNLREQVGRAPAVLALLYGMAQAPVLRRNRIRVRRPWAYDRDPYARA